MIGWLTGRLSGPVLAKAGLGLAVALLAAVVALALTGRAYVAAKAEVAAEIERCETEKAEDIAEAERVAREAEKAAADAREAQLRAQIQRADAAAATERRKTAEAEAAAAERDREIRRMAEEAFDEDDDIPDSLAALNAYLTSRTLRCVLQWSKDQAEAGGGGDGEDGVCADPEGADGMHPGFSNVTYGDALRYWGADRAAAIRLNQRMAEIRRLEGEVVDGGHE